MIIALIASLVALCWSSVRTYFLRRKMRRIEKVVDGFFLLAFSGLLAQVVLADGTITDDETEFVRALFDKMGLTLAERAMCVGNCVMVQNGRRDAREGAKALATALNPSARTFLYTLLWRVANADRCVSDAERRVLDEIGGLLKIDSDVLSRIRAGDFPEPDRKALDDAGVPATLSRLSRLTNRRGISGAIA